MSFKQAINHSNSYTPSNMTSTANGAPALKSTKNPILDFFFMAGSLRNKQFNEYRAQFDAAFSYDERLTMQLVLWLRDVRGGAGERETTRKVLKHMEEFYKGAALKMIPVLAEFGRWDDLLVFTDKDCKELAYRTIAEALRSGNALCAKWMPRIYKLKKVQVQKEVKGSGIEGTFAKAATKTVNVVNRDSVSNKNRQKNNAIARELMSVMNLTEKEYRKLLSSLTQVVESKMCDNNWTEINYGQVPSVASSRYVNAFKRHDQEGYVAYLEKLANGEAKVNASAIFPYDVLKNMVPTPRLGRPTAEQVKLAVSQWDALPNYLDGAKVLPMVDTSGSMSCSAGGTDMSCMFVAVSLGLYIADKQDGAFKNLWLNFSTDPQLFELKGKSIAQKAFDLYNNYSGYNYWSGTTNIGRAFDKVLDVAIKSNLAPEDMPEKLLVFSDMEFNNSTGGWGKTPFKVAEEKFKKAGYKLPHVVFWNLNARPGNNPVSSTDTGVSLVSGFSPNILKSILSGNSVDPVQTMLETIDAERYRVFG